MGNLASRIERLEARWKPTSDDIVLVVSFVHAGRDAGELRLLSDGQGNTWDRGADESEDEFVQRVREGFGAAADRSVRVLFGRCAVSAGRCGGFEADRPEEETAGPGPTSIAAVPHPSPSRATPKGA